MKASQYYRLLLPVLLLGTLAFIPAKAVTPVISGLGVTTGNQVPGSATDYTLFLGTPTGAGENTVLNDFSAAINGLSLSGPASGSIDSTVTDPAGNPELTGEDYAFNTSKLATFTLGKQGSTFNFADFDINVIFGTDPQTYINDTSIQLTLFSGATQEATFTQAVSDTNTNTTEASYASFNILGATSGETLVVSVASSTGNIDLIGGASFSAVPEPGAWAMLLLGMGILGFIQRRRFAL
jgi:hypothetical protein